MISSMDFSVDVIFKAYDLYIYIFKRITIKHTAKVATSLASGYMDAYRMILIPNNQYPLIQRS